MSEDYSYIIYRRGEEIGVYLGSEVRTLLRKGTLLNTDTYEIEGMAPSPPSIAHLSTLLNLEMSFLTNERRRRNGPDGWTSISGRR